MTRPTDKLRDALRNARFEAQKRTDKAGVRDEPDDTPVFDRSRRRRRLDALERDIRNIKNGWNDHDDGY